MLKTEIVLIIIGFLCLCISFFISKKKKNAATGDTDGETLATQVWSERDDEIIYEHLDKLLEDKQTDLMQDTEDQMNRLCNDKIMAIDEFSKQLLEKIHMNHEEVVFMYSMLNEKQKELKEDTKKASDALKEAKNVTITPSAVSHTIQADTHTEQGIKRLAPEIIKEKVSTDGSDLPIEEDLTAKTGVDRLNSIHRRSEAAAAKKLKTTQTPPPARSSSTVQVMRQMAEHKPTANRMSEGSVAVALRRMKVDHIAKEDDSLSIHEPKSPLVSDESDKLHDEIKSLYKKGMSVVDISKELGVGQGEVKLVIALYGGRRIRS